MANKTNSGRLTPANWIAILAMALLALFTFFGHLYGSDSGQFGMALLLTLLEVALLTTALVLAIKAKSATSHFGLWRIVKYVALALYVIVAIVFARPLLKYFHIMSQKQELQAQAMAEIDAIGKLYADYGALMESRHSEAVQRLKDYMRSRFSGGGRSTSVEDYMALVEIGDSTDIDDWSRDVRSIWKVSPDTELENMRNKVNAWGLFDLDIAQVGSAIEEKAEQAAEQLNDKVKNNCDSHHIIPVIDIIDGIRYEHKGYVQQSFSVPEAGGFHNALTSDSDTTVVGWVLFVILHLLILLNYLATRPSGVVPAGKKRRANPGNGVPL